MSGRDRLDLIALLARIAETKSLSAAARIVGISQPSASRLLKQIEAMAGATLVQRSTPDLNGADYLLGLARNQRLVSEINA